MFSLVAYLKSHPGIKAKSYDHGERGAKVVGKCPVYFPIASKQRAKIAESLEAEPASAFPPSLPPYIKIIPKIFGLNHHSQG